MSFGGRAFGGNQIIIRFTMSCLILSFGKYIIVFVELMLLYGMITSIQSRDQFVTTIVGTANRVLNFG